MSTLHTSGPWVHRVMTMPRKVWAALGRSEIQVVAKNGNVIAAVWCAEDRPGEKEANAALIAAAPDLLFALEQLVGMAVVWEGVDGRRNIQLENSEAYQRARAVVTKATGAA